ncbi:mechanosensitive channel MscK [Morganella psychrotolerans]|uniref:mechanosensitive channel MscK n=1 Tax=Morganella psychrotolerans TaxID=368603 RepID=UPI0039AF446E
MKRVSRIPASGLSLMLFFRMFTCCLLTLSVLWQSAALAAAQDIPDRNTIQTELSALNNRKDQTANDKLAVQDLERALVFYDNLDSLKDKSQQLKKQVDEAPRLSEQVSQKLTQIKSLTDEGLAEYKTSIQNLPLAQLEQKLNSTLEALQTAQNNLSSYNSDLIALQTQPERAQNIMYANVQRLQQIRALLNDSLAAQKVLRPTEIEALQIEQYTLQQQIDFQKRALQSNTLLQNVLQLQRDYVVERIKQLEGYIDVIQETVSGKRLDYSEEAAKEAQSSDDSQRNIQDDPLVLREIALNHDLSEKLVAATRNNNQLVQRTIKVKSILDRALQSERNLKEQITVLRGSLLLSRILFKEQIDLPQDLLIKDLPDRIADLRLEQFEINQQRDKLYQPDSFADTLIADYGKTHDMPASEAGQRAQKHALVQVVSVRQDLLDQLNTQMGNQISQAINLQLDQTQLVTVVASLEKTLAQQIFWVNSNKPVNLAWFQSFPGAAKQELTSLDLNWSLQSLGNGFINSLYITIPLMIIALLLRFGSKNIDTRLSEINANVGRLKKDRQIYTPMALGLVLIKTLPSSLLVIAFGYFCLKTGSADSALMWTISRQLAFFWVLFEWSYRIMKPDGIAVTHFGIDAEICRTGRRRLIRLALPLLPIMLWAAYGMEYPLRLVDDVIGQLVVPVALVFVFAFTLPFCIEIWREKGSHLVRATLLTLLTFSPLVLVVLVGLGYYYTALRLSSRWIDSLYLLLLWYIVYHTSLRGLALAARRLTYQRALARRQKQLSQHKEQHEGDEIPEVMVEEPPMSMELINQQSLRMTSMVLFIVFAAAFYGIWSDFITIFSFFDSFTLWHSNVDTALGNVVEAVTLGDLILSVLIVVVSWIMMRNLPGLLEVLVLSRLSLRQGTSYAITTIMTYMIVGIGTIAAFGMLGVSWGKLQWLAAALTFGLSFGLQEIFANFVSGIIILFERPIRIGDTVTIGTFSGTVNKIRIRATTVIDFDRKEVIIPNKAFMTERLTNWSLSDTVTRIVISVGVAYGSDLDKVREVLLKAATDNPKVMTDPAPGAYFMTFGASSLDHELRFYVRTIGDRGATKDEVNRAIDQMCRENDINIAFNQLEVYLHDQNSGKEVQVQGPNNGVQPA